MPRLNCTFADFIDILLQQGFMLHRQSGGSHTVYRGIVGGNVCLVTVACHRMTDNIKTGTLNSMIRQSGLPKTLFRS